MDYFTRGKEVDRAAAASKEHCDARTENQALILESLTGILRGLTAIEEALKYLVKAEARRQEASCR